jgi:hypothetical protein
MGVFSRPFGTDSTPNVFPAVNCRAIVRRPYGTKPENVQTPLRGGSLAVRTKSAMPSQFVTVDLGMHRSERGRVEIAVRTLSARIDCRHVRAF